MSDNIQKVLLVVLDFIRVELKLRIAEFLDFSLLHSLRNRQETSFSATQQTRIAERWLVNNQSEIEQNLHERMATAFTQQPHKKDIAYEDLKLLGDESLGVIILRAEVVTRLLENSRKDIMELEARLEVLSQAGATINAKAFTPAAIADGLIDSLNDLETPTEVGIMLMEAYRDRGTEMLAKFYRDLNALLIHHHILPDFQYRAADPSPPKTRQKSEGTAKPSEAVSNGETPADSAGAPVGANSRSLPGTGHTAPLFPATAGREGTVEDTGNNAAPAWPTVATGSTIPAHIIHRLDEKLTVMERALAHLTADTWNPGTLRDAFNLPPPMALSPEQEESIDHIEAVFLDLLRDTRLSPRFRLELNRLILPIMSLRLSDAALFKDPDNPVRRFLRQLALLGFRDKELPICEFERISLIVGHIVSERARELVTFSNGADALYTIARSEVQRQLEKRHRVRAGKPAANQGLHANESDVKAHHYVQDVLRRLSMPYELPLVVQNFVLNVIAPWMMGAYRQHGRESSETQESLSIVVRFFELLGPSVNTNEHKQRISARAVVIEQIATAVMKSGDQEKETVAMLNAIAEYFDSLNSSADAGLSKTEAGRMEGIVSYIDRLPVHGNGAQNGH